MRKPAVIVLIVLVVAAAAGGGWYYWFGRTTDLSVTAEPIRKRELEAIVSASGKIQPKRQVNISANQMGKVTRLAVEEGHAGMRIRQIGLPGIFEQAAHQFPILPTVVGFI